jgi:hypothetical protein
MNEKTKEELKADAIKAERERIEVTTSKATEAEGKEVEEKTEIEKVDDDGEVEPEETIEEKEKEVEASEKTEEQLEAEKQEAKTAAEKARIQKRIDKEVAKRKVLEAENAELKKQLAAKSAEDGAKFTKEDIEAEAKRIADEKINEREFTNACNRLADGAKKLDKDFDKKIQALSEDVAPLPGYMIGILDDIENGAQVLKHFADNQDVYEDIYTLNPVKMATAITKLGSKLATETKPKPKSISKVPPPNEPVNGAAKTTINLSDKDPMEDWIRKRNLQVAERQAAKRAGMR